DSLVRDFQRQAQEHPRPVLAHQRRAPRSRCICGAWGRGGAREADRGAWHRAVVGGYVLDLFPRPGRVAARRRPPASAVAAGRLWTKRSADGRGDAQNRRDLAALPDDRDVVSLAQPRRGASVMSRSQQAIANGEPFVGWRREVDDDSVQAKLIEFVQDGVK